MKPDTDHRLLLEIIARRARGFPNYPLGYHIPEVFAALGEEPPDPAQSPALAIEDPVTVPRGLLGAAAIAIDRKQDAPKTLKELRQYTFGDLPAPADHNDLLCYSSNMVAHIVAAKVREALQRQPVQWQPISTAPKDGTRILLGGGTWGDDWRAHAPAVMVGWWECPKRGAAFWNTCAAEAGHVMFPYSNPTHWSPLPDGPGAAQQERKS